ncbi:MAG: hypothetical protein ABIZ04_01705 [Opitutus sp.]
MNPAAVISSVAEINRLHAEAKQHAVASRRSLGAALVAAWQAGHLLMIEKKRVRQTMGGGAWLLWLEQNFRGTPRTAQRYMKLAKGVADVAFLQGMSLRQAYDRLGIPMEEKHAAESFPLQSLAPHLLLVSKLVRALPASNWQRLPADKRAALRRDLSPLYQRMRPLFEDGPAVSPHPANQLLT